MLLTLDDFEPAARKHLPRPLFGYVAGAAETGAARQDNRDALDAWRLIPSVLRGVEGRSSAARLFGQDYAAPFGIAPMGLSALMARDGDLALARAAQAAGIPFVLSGSSLTPMERVVEANPDAWFQAYLPGEDDRIRALLGRVRAAGFRTLVLTADTAVLANRENNLRAGFSTPLRITPRLLWDFAIKPAWVFGTFAPTLARGMPHFENSFATRGAPIISKQAARDFGRKDHLNWDHLALMRDLWPGKLVLKGVINPADVARARGLGCDGVILSNHGGRQLDHAISPLRVLPEARKQAAEMALMIDGGIRRGTDVIKALALGADLVWVGRPFLYAATLGGQGMVERAAEMLRSEVHRNLGLLGLRDLSEVGPAILHPV
ncbi:alpha-hydroxy acid oxidase [Tropicibacter naphthalenivorans]|uniref:(S)-mandelate dehydrogenase n=1 Tax=Tropicibacter naphthalenivorans TaxID=441103 RepID=A0A0P1GJE1_9RHOB|nr:alpha-hydroxy acid oxidase [Tropicibacter naphthalenivorans]CUH82224.1 (S)-mandelate dehydrogenase [Tropicibacter naphthalenivorans]SMD04882.1 L-lactate dehydrogenase (cytochrome) [Tropicibacter naphthalenivorans]